MNWRLLSWSVLGVIALLLAIGGVWIFSLPAATAASATRPIPFAGGVGRSSGRPREDNQR